MRGEWGFVHVVVVPGVVLVVVVTMYVAGGGWEHVFFSC